MNKSSGSSCPLGVLGVPLLGEVVAVGQMVEVPVDLQILPHDQVFGLDDLSVVGLVGPSFEELAIPEAGVLGGRLVDLQAVIVEVVGDDELAVAVLGLGAGEDGVEAQADLLVDPLEEVLLGRLGDEAEDVAERVLLRADAVVRRDDDVCVKGRVLDLGASLPLLLAPEGGKTMLNLCR